MAGYRKKNADGPNSEDKALDLFAEMMIEKIEGIQKDWKKPWFTEGTLQWPRNLHGREYNGMNAFMLLCTARKKGTRFPVSARSIVFRSSISPERMERNCRVSPCFVVKNPFRSCSPRSLVSIRRLRRKSSMTITRNSPMTKRNNTMSIRRCRCSGSSMSRKLTCRKRDRSCGKTGARKFASGNRGGRAFQFCPSRYDDKG